MKKRAFYIMTVMTLVLLFSGCGGGQAQTQPAGTQAAAAQTRKAARAPHSPQLHKLPKAIHRRRARKIRRKRV